MRTVHYAALFVGLLAVQACGGADKGPPAFDSAGSLADRGAEEGEGDVGDDEAYGDEGAEETELEGEEGAPIPPSACSVSYEAEVYPKIREQWRCGASQCHGAPGEHAPVMDTSDVDGTYDLLITHVHAGKKLVDTKSTDPNASALYCLMQGTCGKRMPYQGVSAADLALVEAWLRCGGKR